MSRERIPVTVIGGYLGAGKTTLVNRLLTEEHGRRLAVIVNDFGEIPIDETLLAPAVGGMRALANGCICCTAVDGLGMALRDLAMLEPAPEHLLIEVSGVGDPRAVAQWGRTPGFRLDGVVVVVDPSGLRGWVDDRYVGDTVVAQLRTADLILLSRHDVTTAAERSGARRLIAGHTDAPVLDSTDVPLDVLVGRPAVASSPADDAAHARHKSWTVRPGPVARDALMAWLDGAPAGVVRVKGHVPAAGLASTWRIQKVGRRAELEEGAATSRHRDGGRRHRHRCRTRCRRRPVVAGPGLIPTMGRATLVDGSFDPATSRIAPRPPDASRRVGRYRPPTIPAPRPAMTIRVFLVDDHELVREGVRAVIGREDDIEVVGEASTAAEARTAIASSRADVALVDLLLPDGDGIDLCRTVAASAPGSACILLVAYPDDGALMAAIRAEVAGFLLKRTGSGELLRAIRVVASGGSLIDPVLTSRLLDRLRTSATRERRGPGSVT
ncbi:MAG: GTP-binding protein [Acidimicrobiales bacterium]